jgi:hypothetical protein
MPKPRYLTSDLTEDDKSAIRKVLESSRLHKGPKTVLRTLLENGNQPVSLDVYVQSGYHMRWNEILNNYFRTHDMAYRLRKVGYLKRARGTDTYRLYVVAEGNRGTESSHHLDAEKESAEIRDVVQILSTAREMARRLVRYCEENGVDGFAVGSDVPNSCSELWWIPKQETVEI